MAIEMEIPKDIRKYEAKLIGPFTTRQTVCAVPAATISILVFTTLKNYISSDLCIMLVLITIAPLLLCGWYKPYGMPFEKFVRTVFTSIVLAPVNRIYATKNVYEEISNADQAFNPNKKKKKVANSKSRKTGSKNPELIAYK